MTDKSKRIGDLVRKAHRDLSIADYLLPKSPEQAARMGYMAAFHAALAAVLSATGKEPKTHRGARLAFGELILSETSLSRDLGAFMSSAYESKDIADYQTEYEVDDESAKKVIAGAQEVVRHVEAFLNRAECRLLLARGHPPHIRCPPPYQFTTPLPPGWSISRACPAGVPA